MVKNGNFFTKKFTPKGLSGHPDKAAPIHFKCRMHYCDGLVCSSANLLSPKALSCKL